MSSRVEDYARALDPGTTKSVRAATRLTFDARTQRLAKVFSNPEEAKDAASKTKSFVLANLKSLLLQFEKQCIDRGIAVHWASDSTSANRQIVQICREFAPAGGIIAKAKSMATEEIHLNEHLIEAGYTPVETDLGEFVVQLDHDTPSHIVAPIIHKNRKDIAASFDKAGLGEYTEKPEELTMQARAYLRSKFREAQIGISGVNFAIAETGRIVIVENEGNNRLSTTVPKLHIAVMGIEKLLPRESDLALFLPLLAGSATGQAMTTYVHMISGPKLPDELDGPEQVHLVLLDNGRSRILNGRYRDILRCIRCGACLNACPVYRQASGHGYGHVYSGPLGAVLAPALEGTAMQGELAKASSLCGLCEEVCPVRIPIPEMLLHLRSEMGSREIPWKWFGVAARDVRKWKAGIKLLPIASHLPNPMASAWKSGRDLPHREGRDFRRWWRERS